MRRAPLAAILPLLLALCAPAASAETPQPLQVLEGRIVRALTVDPADPSRVLVGTKGNEPGTALVLESRDAGRTWTALNGGKPLDPQASDVQALAFGPDGTILAGTWKHGLYLSHDDGASFGRDQGFPSVDVRDIALVAGEPPALYAATGSAGVVRSDDGGRSWTALGPAKTYVWSVAVSRPSHAALYAVSPERGVFGSIDLGESWYPLFTKEGAYALDASDYGTDSFIVAGDSGLHFSLGGKQWLRLPDLPQEKLSSILGEEDQAILVGSWADGVLVLDEDGGLARRLLRGVPVVHLARAGPDLLVGTWGQGLYIFPGWFKPA